MYTKKIKIMGNNKTSGGIGLGTIVFLIFLIMKLAEIGQVANWSWWWVTSPLWIPLSMVLALSLLIVIIKILFRKS